MTRIGIIGTGYWGKHHVRVFSSLSDNLVGIADIDPSKKKLAEEYKLEFFTNYFKLLEKVDAVSIVTPPATHFQIAKDALEQKKHVLLEKPFVFKINEAKKLNNLAQKNKLILMPGHIFLYHPAVGEIKKRINRGELGKIHYLIFQWLNLGIIRGDVNALWNFAPHPFSILYYLLRQLPLKIQAIGRSFIQEDVEDVVFLTLEYKNRSIAQVNLSWLNPVKVREATIVGSKELVYFNDLEDNSKLRIYNKGVSKVEYDKFINWENYAEFKQKRQFGKVGIPKLKSVEPLRLELEDFLTSIEKKKKPVSSFDSAIAVVTMLEAAQQSLEKKE